MCDTCTELVIDHARAFVTWCGLRRWSMLEKPTGIAVKSYVWTLIQTVSNNESVVVQIDMMLGILQSGRCSTVLCLRYTWQGHYCKFCVGDSAKKVAL